jgi:flagellar assembly protein FliH
VAAGPPLRVEETPEWRSFTTQWEQQWQNRLRQERDQAHAEGLAAGARREEERWREALERSAAAVAELARYKPKLREQVEADAVRLSLAIAQKILRRELSVDPEALAGLVRVALEKVSLREVHQVRVAVADAAAVEGLLQRAGAPAGLQVISDPALERGAMLFEAGRGQLDVSIQTQLEEIERGLTDLLARRS